jgi:hypothetical protein
MNPLEKVPTFSSAFNSTVTPSRSFFSSKPISHSKAISNEKALPALFR